MYEFNNIEKKRMNPFERRKYEENKKRRRRYNSYNSYNSYNTQKEENLNQVNEYDECSRCSRCSKCNKYINHPMINSTNLTSKSFFIDELIKKRISTAYGNSFYHIAALVNNVIEESKFNCRNWKNISVGENSERIRRGTHNINLHAEIDALNKVNSNIDKKRKRFDLLVLRINKSGDLCESAPCLNCTNELKKNNNVKIKKLYFSRYDGTIIVINFSDWCNTSTEHFHISKGWRKNKISNNNKIFDINNIKKELKEKENINIKIIIR